MDPRGRGAAGRTVRVGLLAAIVVVVLAAPACSQGSSDCAALPRGAFIGTATSVGDGGATYRVDRVVDAMDAPLDQRAAVGREVRVRYRDGDEAFLEVGRSYRITLLAPPAGALDPPLESAVDGACARLTTNADGSAIDTGLFAQPWARSIAWWTGGIVVAVIVLGGVAAGVSGYLERREDRREEARHDGR